MNRPPETGGRHRHRDSRRDGSWPSAPPLGATVLGRAFRSAVEDSRAAYRLGYQPSHDEWNGKFREIRIAVKRPGVRLRHRSGYFAQPGEPAEDWYRSGVLGAAMWSPTDATGLGLTVRPFPAAPDTLDLDIKIDARDVSLEQIGDRWRGQLDLWLVQLGPGDALLGTVSHVAGLIWTADLREVAVGRAHSSSA
jgi:hypothetical protein